MKYDTSELCDIYQEDVNVVEPLFSNFGGRSSFGGQIITVKCFEDNGLLYDLLEENGRGRVLLVDGGVELRVLGQREGVCPACALPGRVTELVVHSPASALGAPPAFPFWPCRDAFGKMSLHSLAMLPLLLLLLYYYC